MNLQIIFIFTFVKWSVSLDTGVLLVDSLRKNFLALEDELWTYVLQQNKDNSVDPGIEVLKRFKEFDDQIKELPQSILYGMSVPKKSEQFLLFFSDVRVVHDLYEKFLRYQIDVLSTSKKDYSEYKKDITVASVVNDILYDPKNNVNKILRQINNQSIILMADLIRIISDDLACEYPTQPGQQIFYNLYNLIASIELKGYVMTQFALMASRLQEVGNYTKVSIEARKEYKIRMKRMYEIKPLMNLENSLMYRCDPKNHIEGVTYDQVTRLIQAHIQNEADLNPTRSCTSTCTDYSYTTSSKGCYDASSDYCKYRKPCFGNIHDCQFIESHMTTCISPQWSNRRYEYIKLNSGGVLGSENSCTAKNVYSWTRWFVHCSTCLCYCDDHASSDRFFNLRPTTADVKNNRVVTGMKLIKADRIFHIQIQEGKLLPHGYIDQSTVRWVPIQRYSIFEMGVSKGIDYHTMDYSHRTIYLDTLTGEENNHIITGVRFVLNNGRLQFQITVTPFNFTTGELYTKASYVVVKNEGSRHNVDIKAPDIPTKSPPSEPNFDSNMYLNFQPTDLYKDAAQTTIPFIDIQPVYAEPAVPLKSAGIYYKGQAGYGGFIGMTAKTYDYTNNLKFEFPDMNSREDDSEGYEVEAS